ncbi:MAG: hypothetical protein ACOX67_05570 [Oscillospiraceae bacterium]|jgi:hypothetical protein
MSDYLQAFLDAPLNSRFPMQTVDFLLLGLTAALVLSGIMMLVYRLCHDMYHGIS